MHEVGCGLAVAGVMSVEIGSFQCVIDFVFVFFCDVEYEWPEACVMVLSVLFPGGCASDGNNYTCACFGDFYG